MTGVKAEKLRVAQAEETGQAANPAVGGAEGAQGAAGTDAAPAADPGVAIDPMSQFEIKRYIPIEIFGVDVSFTNSALFMVIALGLISTFMIYAMRGHALVPGRVQSMAELAYEFVANMVRDNTGREGMKYFPFIFTLFVFILVLNMLGMVPMSFTVTSHIIVTFILALAVISLVIIVGFARNGVGFLRLFAPSSAPLWLLPLLIVIEVISFLIRPVSLSVRLFANMLVGHMMLKVFASFVVALGIIGGWAPLAFMVAFTGLEILIAFLQAFVFTVLSCIYLNDALHLHDH